MKVQGINNTVSFKANKMPLNEAKYLNSRLLQAQTADIFCHTSTDEDAFSSAVMMYEYLADMGKTPRILCSDKKENLGFDKKQFNIITYENFPDDTKKADIALCLDFSQKERIRGKALDYLEEFSDDDILCMDHHYTETPVTDNCVIIEEPHKNAPDIKTAKNMYIDSSAKSATSVIFRFFEALGIKMSKRQQLAAYCGMMDDMNKNGYVKINNGGVVSTNKKLDEDKNAKEVYDNLDQSLSEEEKRDVICHLDVFANLSEEEKNFRKRLYGRIQLNDNSKMAYVVIAPDDCEWINLGGDNNITSKILRDFRVRVLEHKNPDEFLDEDEIERLDKVQMAAVFYPDYKTGRYRISVHSNKDYAGQMIEYNRDNYCKNLTAGGHKNRAGGSMAGLDEEKCRMWVDNFVNSSEKIAYRV